MFIASEKEKAKLRRSGMSVSFDGNAAPMELAVRFSPDL